MGECSGFGEDLEHKHPPKPQTNQLGDLEAKSTRQPQFCPGDLLSIGLKVSKGSFARTDETNFDLIFALLRIGTHHQAINIKGIITFINQVIFKGILKGIFGRIFKGIIKSIFEGILKGITKGFFKGIIKGIISVSLRVIDVGFCLGNEFLTLRRGLSPPSLLNLVLRGCRVINDERVIEVCRFLGENSVPCSGNKNLKQSSRGMGNKRYTL